MSNVNSQQNEVNFVNPLDFRTTVSIPNIVDSLAIDMPASEFKVWILLYAMTNNVVPRKLSNRQMAHMTGVGTATIKRAKQSLSDKKLIVMSNSRKTAVTLITLDELWRRNAELNGVDPDTDVIKHFFRVPRSLLLNPELTATDFRVWCHIKRVCGDGGTFFKAEQTTVSDSGVGIRQLRESIKTLLSHGLITGADGRYSVPVIRTNTFDDIMLDAIKKPVRSLAQNGSSLAQNGSSSLAQNGSSLAQNGSSLAQNGSHKNKDHNNKEFNKESLSKNRSYVIIEEPAQGQACDGVGEQRELKEKEELDTYGATIPADDDSEAAALARWNRVIDLCCHFLVERNGEDGDSVVSLDWAKSNAERMIKPAKNILAYRNYDLSAAKAALDAVRAKHIKRAYNPTTLDYVWPDVKAHFDAAVTPVDESSKIIGVVSLEEVDRRREQAHASADRAKALAKKRGDAARRVCDLFGIDHAEYRAFLGSKGISLLDRAGEGLFSMTVDEFCELLSADEIDEIRDRGVDIRLHA